MSVRFFWSATVLGIAALVPQLAQAQSEALSPAKRAEIERLLQTTGALQMGRQISGALSAQVVLNLQRTRPDIPKQVLDTLPAEVAATFEANTESLKNEIIPIYHRHFNQEELRQLNAFYATELGKKTIRVMPAMMGESMVVGQRWGQALAPQVNQRVTEKLRQQGIKP